jgi:hypothetical protein
MKTMHELQEIQLPLTIDDFEVGDRVYSMSHGEIAFGTIVSNPWQSEGHVTVKDDSGYCHSVHLSCFVKGAGFDYYGKIPNLSKLRIGSRISRLNKDGIREYSVVTQHLPDQIISVREEASGAYFTSRTSAGQVLEKDFRDWQIEG